MALTREFKQTILARARADPSFRRALLREGTESMLAGDLETGKAILRDYIKATIGFEGLAKATDRPAKSLIRMLGKRGNPKARNLFGIIGHLQRREGVRLEVRAARTREMRLDRDY